MDCCTAQKDTLELWAVSILSMFQWVFDSLCYMLFGGEKSLASEASNREAVNEQAARLLDEHGNRILRLAYSYLHNMNDAEDVLQDTLIQFLKTAPVLSGPEHEKAWLLRVAANLSKNRIDYNRLRTSDELNEELIAEEREDLSFVWEAVKALPANQREAIHLFYQEGYSTAEIAAILGRREATVRSDLRRGRDKLKDVLKEAYDF
ncbi:MAG: sigma-70 family RNA polymerase sigma factor [Clostridia bacterium]|nr:sigma-70 family RNA polymerase sigma factor [Clostridia bacterium]